jgi:hypothetical protein
MSTSKHDIKQTPPRDDLTDNPGIGQSKGAWDDKDVEEIAGDNTTEGDVGNDVTPTGAVNPNQRGRTH